VDASLLAEAVAAFSAPMVPFLGGPSQLLVGSVVQSPSVAQPSFCGVGSTLLSPFSVGGFPLSSQWYSGLMGDQLLGFLLLPPRPLLSLVIRCSPQFLLGISWREQQSPRVFKVGVYSKGNDLEGEVTSYPGVVQVARSCYRTMGVSYRGNEKGFLDFFALIDEGQHQKVSVSTSKPKGYKEIKNLECSINFDARGVGSSQEKGKRAHAVVM
jgi:hypothetical protein